MTITEALKSGRIDIGSDKAILLCCGENYTVYHRFDLSHLYNGTNEEKAVEALLTGESVE